MGLLERSLPAQGIKMAPWNVLHNLYIQRWNECVSNEVRLEKNTFIILSDREEGRSRYH